MNIKFKLTITILLFLILSSCYADNLIKNLSDNSSPNYYLNKLSKDISSAKITKALVLETNLQRETVMDNTHIDFLYKFLEGINQQDTADNKVELPAAPKYRIYLLSNDHQYIINIYNEKYIAIFPWDGTKEMDIIDMTNTKSLYNLYNVCKYINEY